MPRGVNTERTRDRIVRSALEVFGDNGFQGASLDDIAAKAGVTKGALYWHFKGKVDLYMATFDFAMEEYGQLIAASITSDQCPREILSNVARAIIESYSDDGPLSRFYSSMMMDSKLMGEEGLSARAAKAYDSYRESIAQLFVRWSGTDAREGYDPAVAATAFIALLDGIAMQWMVDRNNFDLRINGMRAVELFLDGLENISKG